MPRPPKKGDHYRDPFPSALRDLKGENKTSQETLKAVLGVAARQSVTGYTDGSTIPTADKIVAVADYYGVTTDYLLYYPNKPKSIVPDMQAALKVTGLSERAICNLQELDRYTRSARDYLEKVEGEIDAPDAFDAIDDLLSCEEGHAFLSQLAAVSHLVTLAKNALITSESMGFEERHNCLRDASQSLKVEMYYLSEAVRRLSQDVYKADAVLKRIDDVLVSDIVSYCEKKESEADDGECS